MGIAALVLVATVGWWYWPRGDARFQNSEEARKEVETQPVEVSNRTFVDTAEPVFVSSAEYRMSSRIAGFALIGDDGHEHRPEMPRTTYWVTGRIMKVDAPFLQSPSVAGEVAKITVDVSGQNVRLPSGERTDCLYLSFMPSEDSFQQGKWVCLGFDDQGRFVDCLYPVQRASDRIPE